MGRCSYAAPDSSQQGFLARGETGELENRDKSDNAFLNYSGETQSGE